MSLRCLALCCAFAAMGCGGVPAAPTKASEPVTTPSVRYTRVAVDGVGVFVREAGPPDAPTIVLLHGFPSSSHMFRGLIPLLARRYRVLAPDYPGFGNSDRPDPATFEYTFDHLAEMIERLLDARGVRRFALFMHDYGGPIGFRIAVRHPGRITALIVQNANVYEEGLSPGFFKLKRPLWAERTPESEAPILELLKEGRWRSQYSTGARAPDRLSPDGPNLDQWAMERPFGLGIQVALQADYRVNLERYGEWQRYLRTHRPPTLIVWGKNDPIFLEAGALAFKRDVPDCELHLLETGHFPLEEDAEATARHVLSFLRALMFAEEARRRPPARGRAGMPRRGAPPIGRGTGPRSATRSP